MKVVSMIDWEDYFIAGKEYEVIKVYHNINRGCFGNSIYGYLCIGDDGEKHSLFAFEAYIPLKKQSHYRWRKIAKAQGKIRRESKHYMHHKKCYAYLTSYGYFMDMDDPFDFKTTRAKYSSKNEKGYIDTIKPILFWEAR